MGYEYKVVVVDELTGSATLADVLNRLGADRWELILARGNHFIFKRVRRL